MPKNALFMVVQVVKWKSEKVLACFKYLKMTLYSSNGKSC
jgi:hypothetical protein